MQSRSSTKRAIISEESNTSTSSIGSNSFSSSASSNSSSSGNKSNTNTQNKKSRSSLLELCSKVKNTTAESSPVKKLKQPAYDPTKSNIYLKVFWETDSLKEPTASAFKAKNSTDRVIGILISHMGHVYNLLQDEFIVEGVRNPLFGPSSQFSYRNCYKRSELLTHYNVENSCDPAIKVPEKLNIKYGCYVGHTCNPDEERFQELQQNYAEFIDIMHEYVEGMEDPENAVNGVNNRFCIRRENVYLTANGSETELENLLLHMQKQAEIMKYLAKRVTLANYKNYLKIFAYVDISRGKESCANYTGDGPSSEIIDVSNSILQFNGLILHRLRKNLNYKIKALNKDVFEGRINRINSNINVGDIVISINGINIFNLELSDINNILNNTPLHSIESYSGSEWRRRLDNQNRNRRNNSYQQLMRNVPSEEQFQTLHTNNSIISYSNRISNDTSRLSNNNVTTEYSIDIAEQQSEIVTNINTVYSNQKELNLLWDYNNKCPFCGCLYLTTEKNRKICCNNGSFLNETSPYPNLKPMPPKLKELIVSKISHFARNSVSYNNILSLGATGVDNGSPQGGWEVRHGNHCVILHGRTYHFLTTSHGSNGLHYFLFDAQLDLLAHGDKLNINEKGDSGFKRIYPEYLQALFIELQQINILAQEIEKIGHFSLNPNTDITSKNILVELNTRTSHFDVAAITSNDVIGNRILTIRRKGKTSTSTIGTTDCKLEPLSYPLFFPYGEDGWGESIRKVIKFPQYILSRMLMGEKNEDGSELVLNNRANKAISVNRFQIMSRLGQTYLVDNLSRAIDYRLNWHKSHQKDIFGISEIVEHSSINDNGQDDNENKEHTFLSQSCHGSRRHLRKLSANALAIVSEYGRPSIFITLTCNANWKNITDQLLESQTAFDRPDITCRVFKAKLTAFLTNLRKGYYFPSVHKIIYEMHVIEYQHRGLPHAHIIVLFTNMPDYNDKIGLSEWIDTNISAEFPVLNDTSTEEDKLYAKKVESYMIHKCSSGSENSCLDEDGRCSKNFTNNAIQKNTTFNERGFPQYKRSTEKCLNVVPHNRNILLAWDGHANVEFAGSTFLVLYLYKYLYKGAKKVKLKLTDCDDVSDKDEIKLYIRGRYLCSMDAMWRALGYQTYPSPNPSVRVIKVKTEIEVDMVIRQNKICDIQIYFSRPNHLHHLTYSQFFQLYTYSSKKPTRYHSVPSSNTNDSYYEVSFSFITTKYYIYLRDSSCPSITRIEMVPLTIGEKWYLRLLLYNIPGFSYNDLKTINGSTYSSFQLAAIAAKLVEDENEVLIAFEWALAFSTPAELRSLFIIMTTQGFPTLSIFEKTDFRIKLMEDILLRIGNENNIIRATNELLQDLATRLEDHDKRLSDYGLPEPESTKTELERARMQYDAKDQERLLEFMNSTMPNTTEQKHIFDLVLSAIENKETRLLFIQGIGGCGKTTLAKRILAAARSKGILCVGCASTALAATNYENFDTAHGLFKFPVIEEDDRDISDDNMQKCKLKENLQRLELLNNTQVIIWDEFPSNHKEIFEDVYKQLNGFQGKVVICMGDFRQIAPVIKNGDRQDIVNASIKSSYLWPSFTILKLTINMRLINNNLSNHQQEQNLQKSYGDLILAIGEGYHLNKDADLQSENPLIGEQIYLISNVTNTLSEEDAIKFMYPNGFIDEDHNVSKALLAVTNKDVDHWNAIIQKLNPNETISLLSKDKLCEVDDPHKILEGMLTDDILHQFNNNSVPPHELKLKCGDICIITRNVAKKEGLTNNTRVKIIRIQEYCITVQTLGNKPKVYQIPRIRFQFRLPFGESFQMCRTQFPLRLAYCITINRSQGQEYDIVLLDLRNPSFAHGHLYVGLSRAKYHNKIALLVKKENIRYNALIIKNIIYPELL